MKTKIILVSAEDLTQLKNKIQEEFDKVTKDGLMPPDRMQIDHHDGKKETFFYAYGVAISMELGVIKSPEIPELTLQHSTRTVAKKAAKSPAKKGAAKKTSAKKSSPITKNRNRRSTTSTSGARPPAKEFHMNMMEGAGVRFER